MSLLDRLRSVGGKLGLIQVSPPAKVEDKPAKMASRQVTLEELTTEVRADEVRVLSELPAELSVGLDQVLEAAGVKPPAHGWSIERLEELLKTDQYKTMDRPSAQRAILGVLSAVKAQVEDVVKDAIARDQALDKYEKFVRQKMDDRMVARQRQISQMEDQIKTLEKECGRLRAETKADDDRWREWRKRKVAREKEMAWAIAYLMDKPVITIDPVEGEGNPL